MYNSATVYTAQFGDWLVEEFKKRFPDFVKEGEICALFHNCPKGGEQGWADSVRISLNVKIKKEENEYTNYICKAMIGKINGNCGMAVVSAVEVWHRYQKNGVCSWLLEMITRILSKAGYTTAVGTTAQFQEKIEPRLLKAGWEAIESCHFQNRRTNNKIKFWRINLPDFPLVNVIAVRHANEII